MLRVLVTMWFQRSQATCVLKDLPFSMQLVQRWLRDITSLLGQTLQDLPPDEGKMLLRQLRHGTDALMYFVTW